MNLEIDPFGESDSKGMDQLSNLFDNINLNSAKNLNNERKDIVYKAIDVDLQYLLDSFISNNFDMLECENPYYHYLDEKELAILKDIVKTEYVYNTFMKKIRKLKPNLTNDDYINIGTMIEYYYDN